jgi:putative spermidine/putrescine transport system ATP-binding protein
VPHDVYGQPANLHVARFMGYRNVLELSVESESGERITVSGPDIKLTGIRKQPIANGRANVAMRPEEFVLGAGPGGVNTISGRVDNVEYCGRDSLIDVRTASGTLLHVRATGSPRLDDTVEVHVPVERVLVYPAEVPK